MTLMIINKLFDVGFFIKMYILDFSLIYFSLFQKKYKKIPILVEYVKKFGKKWTQMVNKSKILILKKIPTIESLFIIIRVRKTSLEPYPDSFSNRTFTRFNFYIFLKIDFVAFFRVDTLTGFRQPWSLINCYLKNFNKF